MIAKKNSAANEIVHHLSQKKKKKTPMPMTEKKNSDPPAFGTPLTRRVVSLNDFNVEQD
jgi:hypothetical protein